MAEGNVLVGKGIGHLRAKATSCYEKFCEAFYIRMEAGEGKNWVQICDFTFLSISPGFGYGAP